MKTRLKRLFLLAIILWTPNLVNAASSCSYSEQAEINDIVANVKASYEVVDIYAGKVLDIDNADNNGNIPEIDNYTKGFKINILNITDDIYVQVKNNYDSNILTFRNNNTIDGIATFQTSNVSELITYTIEVYSNKYSCVGEQFRTFTLTTPIYNRYSTLQVCADNPEFYYCQEFIQSERVSYEVFFDNLEKFKEEKANEQNTEENKKFIDKFKNFYENNKLIIYSMGIVIVVAGVATTVILVKKKRSRVL